ANGQHLGRDRGNGRREREREREHNVKNSWGNVFVTMPGLLYFLITLERLRGMAHPIGRLVRIGKHRSLTDWSLPGNGLLGSK
ncbi:uncharacterized, partial [Tachysurus ichikawai]